MNLSSYNLNYNDIKYDSIVYAALGSLPKATFYTDCRQQIFKSGLVFAVSNMVNDYFVIPSMSVPKTKSFPRNHLFSSKFSLVLLDIILT